MELPITLRQMIEEKLQGVEYSKLLSVAQELSERYRLELRDGQWHIADTNAALVYLASRLPATYAAVRTAMGSVAEMLPTLQPKSILDVGAGPGTSLWAANDQWDTLNEATAIEACTTMRLVGQQFAQKLPFDISWKTQNIANSDIQTNETFDLTTISYVLDELEERERTHVIAQLWERTKGVLLIVEPGTTNGWQRILAARQWLVREGATLIAPCPHSFACPVNKPDWCHFSRRVARSKIHRYLKNADAPWEDEKFIFLAVSRYEGISFEARVIAPPSTGKGKVTLKLCQQNGTMEEKLITKREGAVFKAARRCNWGDIYPPPLI